MKHLLAALAVLFCLAAKPAPVPSPPLSQPPVWVIKDGDTEVTLFATVHALPAGVRWLSPEAMRRFDAADRLILETKLPDDRFELGPVIASLGIDAALPPVRERLPASTFAALENVARTVAIPMAALDRMKPWLISITLGEAVLTKAGVTASSGVEPVLLARAKAQSKPLVALESPQQQLGFFANLSEADQIAMLGSTLTDVPNARAEVDRLVKLWQQGDFDTIANEFAKEASASASLHEILLAGRNRSWVDFLVSEMARPGKSFLAVGAGHFGGPDGLLALLEARGLKPERVQASNPPKKKRR